MNLRQLAALAFDDLLARALNGQLSPSHLWLAVEGGSRYAKAVAFGDEATIPVAAERAAKCAKCPMKTERPMRGSSGDSVAYCGEAFTESMETVWKHCGCLIFCTIEGQVHPAGKTVVASEKCPNGFW